MISMKLASAAAVALGCYSAHALAVPSAQISYIEAATGLGSYRYEYSVANTSDPAADAGEHLYDFLLTFDPAYATLLLSLPRDWDGIVGSGFAGVFSLDPSADIVPGASLGGFTFEFSFRVGDLPFEATLLNPDNPSRPVVVSGLSRSVDGERLPAPATSALIAIGLLGIAVLGRVSKVGKIGVTH